jgi:hypothetical protein
MKLLAPFVALLAALAVVIHPGPTWSSSTAARSSRSTPSA